MGGKRRVPILAGSLTAAVIVLYFAAGGEQRPPQAPAAQLPASLRVLLPKSHQDTLHLTVPAGRELDYRIGMQAGSTLVYAWSTVGRSGVLSGEFPGSNVNHGSDGRGVFQAESSGWYHWRWRNAGASPVSIRFKLNGYYELITAPSALPYDR